MQVRAYKNGVLILLYVTPNARNELLYRRSDDSLGLKVAAPALENKANSRVIELLAQVLGISKSSISIFKGEHAKRKELFVENITCEQINKLLNKI